MNFRKKRITQAEYMQLVRAMAWGEVLPHLQREAGEKVDLVLKGLGITVEDAEPTAASPDRASYVPK